MPPNNENYHALAPPQAEAATAELYWVRRVFNGDTPTNAPPLRSVLKGKNVTLDEFRHWAAVVRAFFWWMVEEHLRSRAWAFGWVQDRVRDNQTLAPVPPRLTTYNRSHPTPSCCPTTTACTSGSCCPCWTCSTTPTPTRPTPTWGGRMATSWAGQPSPSSKENRREASGMEEERSQAGRRIVVCAELK